MRGERRAGASRAFEPQRSRSNHARFAAECEQHRERDRLALEIERDPANVARREIVLEAREHAREPSAIALEQYIATLRRQIELDVIATERIGLEARAPRLPKAAQVEARIAHERLDRALHAADPRHTENAHAAFRRCDEIPDVDLDDQRVGIDTIALH